MAKFNHGDVVQVISREATPADAKTQTYYPYYAGLSGTVDKVYDHEVCVKVAPETLPADVAKRHHDIQESIKRKWLDGLSGEARNRLTPEEKQFKLSYTILVQEADLEKIKAGAKPSKKVAPSPEPAKIEKVEPVKAEKVAPAPKEAKSPKAEKPAESEAENGLSEAELAFLREREARLKKG